MTSSTKWRPTVRVGQTWRVASGKTRLVTQLLPERNGQEASIQYRDHLGRHTTITLLTFRGWMKNAERVEARE